MLDGSTNVCERSAGEGDRHMTFGDCCGISAAPTGTEVGSNMRPNVMIVRKRRAITRRLNLKSTPSFHDIEIYTVKLEVSAPRVYILFEGNSPFDYSIPRCVALRSTVDI